MSGITEIIILIIGIVVVIVIFKGIARLFGGGRRSSGNYGGGYSQHSATGSGSKLNYDEPKKKKLWGMNDPAKQHKQFMDSAKKASENAAKTYNDIQKRSAATRKQVDDMTRKTIKRNRGW